MKGKKAIFEFSKEDVDFVQKVLKQGSLNFDDKNEMKKIYQQRIDPSYNPCSGCSPAIKTAFQRLVQIMSESFGVTDIRSFVYPVKEQVLTQKIRNSEAD